MAVGGQLSKMGKVCWSGHRPDHRSMIVCRSPGYAQGMHMTLAVKLKGNATLTLHEMAVFGRPYTGTVGDVAEGGGLGWAGGELCLTS